MKVQHLLNRQPYDTYCCILRHAIGIMLSQWTLQSLICITERQIVDAQKNFLKIYFCRILQKTKTEIYCRKKIMLNFSLSTCPIILFAGLKSRRIWFEIQFFWTKFARKSTFLKSGHFPTSFCFIFVFSIQMMEAITPPTVTQPV